MQGEYNVGFSVHTDNLHELLSLPRTTSYSIQVFSRQILSKIIVNKMSKFAQRKKY